jgi:hypothetical protein
VVDEKANESAEERSDCTVGQDARFVPKRQDFLNAIALYRIDGGGQFVEACILASEIDPLRLIASGPIKRLPCRFNFGRQRDRKSWSTLKPNRD